MLPGSGSMKSSAFGSPTLWHAWMYDSCSAIEFPSIVVALDENAGRGIAISVEYSQTPVVPIAPPSIRLVPHVAEGDGL